MKVVFYASDKPREIMLANALAEGVRSLGDDYEIRRTADYGDDCKYEGPSADTDVACAFGVKGKTRRIIDDHRIMGKATLYFDKGYVRDKGEAGHTLYTKTAVNAADPTAYFQDIKRRPDRWRALGIRLMPRADLEHGHILFCGSSQKYCDFHGLGDANVYAERCIRRISKQSSLQVVYRPKPSFQDARPIAGALFSDGSSTFEQAVRGAHCVVTHGSGAAAEAVILGYPAIVIGEGIAKPVASTKLDAVTSLFWPDEERRYQWASNLAYCQFTAPEFRSGEAWTDLKKTIERLADAK